MTQRREWESKISGSEMQELLESMKPEPKQLSLEEIADELNLIRKDVRAMFDDMRQSKIAYLIFDVEHRLEALEQKLRFSQ